MYHCYAITAPGLEDLTAAELGDLGAAVGATEKAGSVGRTVLWNLMNTPFGGPIYPVNPTRPSVLGIKAYPTVKDIPAEIDLAVVVTNSKLIPGLIDECGELGCKAAVVISPWSSWSR